MLAPVFFVFVFSVIFAFKRVILGRVHNYLHQREVEVANVHHLLNQLRGALSLVFMIVVSLYLSIFHLNLPTWIETTSTVILFVFLTVYLYRFVSFLVNFLINRNDQLSENKNASAFVTLLVKSLTVTVLILWFMSNIGVDINAFIAGLGIASITIAFALQNIMADLFASVTIYLDQPFEIDDFIEVNGKAGTIERIGIRSTHLRSVDGHLVILSNQELTQASISNFKKMAVRRVKQTIGVSATTPINMLREIPKLIQETIDELNMAKTRKVYLDELGDYSWNYVIIYYINSPDVETYWNTKEEINFRILELFERHNITMPYPIQEIQLSADGIVKEELLSPVDN